MKTAIVAFLTVLFAVSCGGNQPIKKQETSEFSEVFQPDWFQRSTKEDEQYIFVFGFGESRDRNVAYDEAKANATQEMTQSMQQKVDAMVTNMRRRAGTGDNEQILKSTNTIFRSVSSNTIQGLSVDKSKTYKSNKTGKFQCYVMMKLSKKPLADKFKQALRNKEALYTEFKEKGMLNELDKQLQTFEKGDGN